MIIGITGSFGTGKTATAKIFGKLGCKVLDADRITHQFLNRQTAAYRKIVLEFGKDILKKDKTVDRRKLAKIIFNDKESLKNLCAILHPYVISDIKQKVSRIKRKMPHKNIVIDAPLLVEAKMADYVDKLIVVKAPFLKQIQRCSKRFRLSADEIKKRIKSQLPIGKKIKFADLVIDNSGSLPQLERQVKTIYKKWKNLSRK